MHRHACCSALEVYCSVLRLEHHVAHLAREVIALASAIHQSAFLVNHAGDLIHMAVVTPLGVEARASLFADGGDLTGGKVKHL